MATGPKYSVSGFAATWIFHPNQVWHAPLRHAAVLADKPLKFLEGLPSEEECASDLVGRNLAIYMGMVGAIGPERLDILFKKIRSRFPRFWCLVCPNIIWNRYSILR